MEWDLKLIRKDYYEKDDVKYFEYKVNVYNDIFIQTVAGNKLHKIKNYRRYKRISFNIYLTLQQKELSPYKKELPLYITELSLYKDDVNNPFNILDIIPYNNYKKNGLNHNILKDLIIKRIDEFLSKTYLIITDIDTLKDVKHYIWKDREIECLFYVNNKIIIYNLPRINPINFDILYNEKRLERLNRIRNKIKLNM